MLRNYLKIAFRNLRKQGSYTAINIFGLAVGLACCLLLVLYVSDELSYDRYNTKADRIYRVNTDAKFGGRAVALAVTPDPLGPTLKKDYPQVEQFVRLHHRGTWLVRRAGTPTAISEDNIVFADSTLFDVFTLPFIAGNPKRALVEPNTVVITESAAKRYFGTQSPMGQTLLLGNQPYRITGLMRDMPTNSHFRADMFPTMLSDDYQWGNWLSTNHYTYIVLKPGTDPALFSPNLDAVVEKYGGPVLMKELGVTMDQFRQSGNRFQLWLMPLTDLHLHSKQTIELAPPGDIQYVYIFSVVALIILLIACVNFMNLATAQSAKRATEVGIRKVLGSERGQLIGQFIIESILTTTFALAIALLLASITLPFFNDIAAKTLRWPTLLTPGWLAGLAAVPIVVGGLAGIYPALFLSAFQPMQVLKGKRKAGIRGLSLRSGLVVFQFTMSVLLIIGTLVVYRQLTYIRTQNLGFDRSHVLTVSTKGSKQAKTFQQEVLNLPGVLSGTLSGYLPVPSDRSDSPMFPMGETDQKKAVSTQRWTVDYDYVKTLSMQIRQGRNFSRAFGADSSGVILNETAVRLLGFRNPIGQQVDMFQGTDQRKTFTVIGVVKNFNYESLRQQVGAVAFFLGQDAGAASFRLNAANVPNLLTQIEATWKRLMPRQPFSYQFMDDRFDRVYRAEQRVGTLTLTFSVLAIFIACLGLFGLAAFTAEARTKEIGVRKVLGASVGSLIALLSRDFIKLVLIAILIASPIAWYAMHRWLQDFAYKIEIEWWMFALAGLLAIGIALLTVSFQSVKAALVNPIKSLRSE
jgi:putative ABC transport system permease protein